jgi:ferredoxin--NADP+ reductase
MELKDLDLSNLITAQVISKEMLTGEGAVEEVCELRLELDTDSMDFDVGQSIAVRTPGDASVGQEHHVRLYTIADAPRLNQVKPEITICVRRCHYIDEFSGEACDGIASNFLCDCAVGDSIRVAGPFGSSFVVPADDTANLLLIGLGTGIAPFRALIKHIYHNLGGWSGKVRIFHGAHTGLEMIYRNNRKNDFSQYMDEETFAAFEAVSPRPHWGEPVDFHAALIAHEEEIREMLAAPNTYVYLAGLASISETLDKVFSSMAGGARAWAARKETLINEGRWSELIY